MQAFIIRTLLWLLPGIGAGPAGVIAGFLLTILSKEGEFVYEATKELVAEVEDPAKHPEFAGDGHGFEKFNYVFDKVWPLVLEKNIDWAQRDLSFVIEFVVQIFKKPATA